MIHLNLEQRPKKYLETCGKNFWTFFSPFKGVDNYYHELATFYQNGAGDGQLCKMYTILVASALHDFGQFFVRPRGPWAQLVWADFPTAYGYNRIISIFLVFYYLLSAYAFHVFYVCLKGSLVWRVLADVYITNHGGFAQNSPKDSRLLRVGFVGVQLLSGSIFLVILFTFYHFFHLFLALNLPIITASTLLGLISMFSFLTLANASISLLTAFLRLGGILIGSIFYLILHRFKQTGRYLVLELARGRRGKRSSSATLLTMLIYLRQNQLTLQTLFSFNRTLSKVFLIFLLVSGPMNTVLVVSLVQSRTTSFIQIPFTILVISQFLGIIVLHLLAAQVSARLHGPFRILLSEFVLLSEGSLINRLKVAHAIEALHSRKRYGITYGDFGLISMAAFAKFVLMYPRFIFFSIKYLNNK